MSLRTSIVLLLCCILAACSHSDLSRRMDQIVQAHVAGEQFSGAVLVARDGQVLLDRGYGLADREWDIPNTPDTRFRLASISRPSST